MVLILCMFVKENVYKNVCCMPPPSQVVDRGRNTAFYKSPIQRFKENRFEPVLCCIDKREKIFNFKYLLLDFFSLKLTLL